MAATEETDVKTGTITDEDIRRQQAVVGYDEPNRTREFHATLSEDAIRNFALSIGDDNPLYTDAGYAAGTRWGGVIAPSIMTAITNMPLLGDRMPREIKAQARGLFKGTQTFMSGGTWEWYRPMYPGDTLYSFEGEESAEEKISEFGGRTVHITRRYVKFNQRGEIVAIYRLLRIMAERKAARDKGKYQAIESAHYSRDDVAALDAEYLKEAPRGSTPRYFEDVQEGEAVGPLLKGPLTTTEVFLAHCAGYGFAPLRMLAASRVAAKDRQRLKSMYSRNVHGAYDTEARVHWDRDLAQKVGNPEAYDWGLQREFWLHHALSDWAGDDGFVIRQHDELRKFNYMGDLQRITGTVTGKRVQGALHLVDVRISATNQRDEETAFAEATLSLPSRDGAPALLPTPPADLQAKAYAYLAEHHRRSHPAAAV
ncbi:MAG: MaoC family dehydratase N-terminal domain-containing protein [Pseudomonadota bacterium]